MKRIKRASASTLFLMELIVAILFFSLCSSVCVAVFVHAHILSRDAKELNMATNLSCDAAEMIRSQTTLTGVQSIFSREYRNATINSSDKSCEISLYFDENFKEIMSDHGVYNENIHITEDDGMFSIAIEFNGKDNNTIYSLSLNHDLLQKGGGV